MQYIRNKFYKIVDRFSGQHVCDIPTTFQGSVLANNVAVVGIIVGTPKVFDYRFKLSNTTIRVTQSYQ